MPKRQSDFTTRPKPETNWWALERLWWPRDPTDPRGLRVIAANGRVYGSKLQFFMGNPPVDSRQYRDYGTEHLYEVLTEAELAETELTELRVA